MTSKMQLSVIVLLVALLSVASAALDCGIHGDLVNGICACHSGYGGELEACEDHVLESCEQFVLSSDHSGNSEQVAYYPELDTKRVNLTAQVLTLSLLGHQVANRSYTNIVFVGSTDAQCSLFTAGATSHNSYWKLGADVETCRDRFALTMNWGVHAACGFKKTANSAVSDKHEYKATILVTYLDQLGEVYEGAGISLTRRSSASYDVYVRFPKIVTVQVEQVTINSVVNLKIAMTAFEFNPDTQEVTVLITAFTAWPNMILGASNPAFAPIITNNANLTIKEIVITSNDCGMSTPNASMVGTGPVGQSCRQIISFKIPLPQSCSFDADYLLNVTVATCRESPESCTRAWIPADFDVNHSDVCTGVTATPLVTGELVAYVDNDHTEESTNFLAGSEGFFAVKMDSVNDLQMNFTDIWVIAEPDESDMTPEPIYFYKNEAIVLTNAAGVEENNYEAQDRKGPVGLIVEDPTVNAEVVGSVVKTQHFRFFFDNNVFGIEPRMSRTFILHATGKIVYKGNEKYKREESASRKVDFVWEVKTGELDSKLAFDVAVNPSAAVTPATSTYNMAVALAPVFGMAVAAIAAAVVVAVVIVKRRKTSGYSTVLTN